MVSVGCCAGQSRCSPTVAHRRGGRGKHRAADGQAVPSCLCAAGLAPQSGSTDTMWYSSVWWDGASRYPWMWNPMGRRTANKRRAALAPPCVGRWDVVLRLCGGRRRVCHRAVLHRWAIRALRGCPAEE